MAFLNTFVLFFRKFEQSGAWAKGARYVIPVVLFSFQRFFSQKYRLNDYSSTFVAVMPCLAHLLLEGWEEAKVEAVTEIVEATNKTTAAPTTTEAEEAVVEAEAGEVEVAAAIVVILTKIKTTRQTRFVLCIKTFSF
jgi:hypothetical protein